MPAYSFVSVGTVDYDINVNPLTPGAPAGAAVGNLLLLPTLQRSVTQTVTAMTGWTQLFFDNTDNWSFGLYGRIADGTADDTPTVTWTGTTADSAAVILAYSGDVYSDISTITAHVSSGPDEANAASDLRLPALTITTDDTLVFGFGMRYKTATSDDATTISHAVLTKRLQHIRAGAGAMMFAVGDLQQTTATNFSGTDWTRDGTVETVSSAGMVIALKSQAAASLAPIIMRWRM